MIPRAGAGRRRDLERAPGTATEPNPTRTLLSPASAATGVGVSTTTPEERRWGEHAAAM